MQASSSSDDTEEVEILQILLNRPDFLASRLLHMGELTSLPLNLKVKNLKWKGTEIWCNRPTVRGMA